MAGGIRLSAKASQRQKVQFHASEITMPKVNLSGMNVEALMDLRMRVDEMLVEHRAKLIEQLERVAVVGCARVGRSGALKGKKVPPKIS